MADHNEPSPDQRIQRALEADVPRIYFNGFVNGFGAGDIVCVLERNGQPTGVINMSYTLAKTLSVSLAQLIATLEEASNQPILTTNEVGKYLASALEVSPRAKPKQTKSRKKKNG